LFIDLSSTDSIAAEWMALRTGYGQVVPLLTSATGQVKLLLSAPDKQVLLVQGLPVAGQTTGVPAQVPAPLHTSPVVQPWLSLQVVPMGLLAAVHTPAAGRQTLSVHGLVEAAQVLAATAAQTWFWQAAEVTQRLPGMVQVVPSADVRQRLLAGTSAKSNSAVKPDLELVAVTATTTGATPFSASAGAVQVPAVVKMGSSPSATGVETTMPPVEPDFTDQL
jgi:hypothetical protein